MHVTCPNCHGQGKVAVRVEAASGLPQIDQIVDSHDAPAQTPYPAEVAFPWTLNPAAQVQQHVQEGEQQIAERNQLLAYVERVAAALPEPDRTVFELCIRGDHSYEEAAAQAGITPAAVRNRLSRLRSRLRNELHTLRGKP